MDIKSFKEHYHENQVREFDELVVTFKNKPSETNLKHLFLSALNEGVEKNWDKGYKYRLDKRPDNQGGWQVHIKNRNGDAFAYRYDGSKSEPHKYQEAPTNMVKDIVSHIFNIDRSKIEEATIIDSKKEVLLFEVEFS